VFLPRAEVPARAGVTTAQIPLSAAPTQRTELTYGRKLAGSTGDRYYLPTSGPTSENVILVADGFQGSIPHFSEVGRNLAGSTAHWYYRPCSAATSSNIMSAGG
jgi:hypothetical protein